MSKPTLASIYGAAKSIPHVLCADGKHRTMKVFRVADEHRIRGHVQVKAVSVMGEAMWCDDHELHFYPDSEGANAALLPRWGEAFQPTEDVVYRVWAKRERGGVFAVFPAVGYTNHRDEDIVEIYELGRGPREEPLRVAMRMSIPAWPALYQPLHEELLAKGHKLNIVPKAHKGHRVERQRTS